MALSRDVVVWPLEWVLAAEDVEKDQWLLTF